ncbi:PadR family transcriptional regulator [Microbacterium sp. NIBRBAC000506063]|uniref:PadR family transcriptional regulator n=1 Tax=Microbacterium sp. NIBRBAC000506063 TaxID=2734618 RepID=UPI0021D40CE6|nr:PadR family transcriptional regulator [Microbacterium sp. NIBRBAC000506063]
MRDAGTVTTRWDAPETGRARRYYAITDSGRAQLRTFADVWHPIATQVGTLLKEES